MPTYIPEPGEIARNWHVIDVEDVILGRLTSQVAMLLCDKHKPAYVPHIDSDDLVIVVSAPRIAPTGNKRTDDMRHSHSSRPDGPETVSIGEPLEKNPRKVAERVIWGMLSKNRLSHRFIGKLKVYPGPEHPYAA